MANAQSDEIMVLLADDAGVEIDIPAWCLSTGNEYLGLVKEETVYRVFVRRACPEGY
jgi:TusA-related sulfurtransferase